MPVAFDTLKFTQRLERAGVDREQAVAHAELARDMILADIATRDDLAGTEASLKGEVASVRGDLSEFRRQFDGSLRELELRMTIKLGAMMAAAVAIVAAVQKLI